MSWKGTPRSRMVTDVEDVRAERDVLDAFALILAQELLDLGLLVLALVQGNADLAAGQVIAFENRPVC